MASPHRRRKRVEIYFILYLVALVLLMPDRPLDTKGALGTEGEQQRVELFPERIRMVCEVERDSTGPIRVLAIDSVNIVRYSPSMTSMHVRATIEDVESGQVLIIEDGSKDASTFARLRVDYERNAIIFSWSPLSTSIVSKSFRVTLHASGTPTAERASAPPAIGSTQFVLTSIVNNQLPPQVVLLGGRVDTLVMRDTSQRVFGEQLSAEFWLESARETIAAAMGREWSNRLSIGGADPARDLVGLPTVRVVSGQPLEMTRYFDQRTLVIKGKTPSNGSSMIEVTAQRTDGKVARATFSVNSIATALPRVPDVLYPGTEVVIDPLLPAVESARAVVREGQREIVSVTSGLLRLRVALADTGKTFTFERTIDGVPDYSEQIAIRSYPAPIIREIKRGADPNTRTIVVQFFSADRAQNRPTLRIVQGNATGLRKLAGFLRAADSQKPTTSWIEVFEVTRKDPSKPFTFSVQAFDERGRASTIASED